MQFQHPEILYALFLLIIPVIVHLFHLQRFVKTPFTNVRFLMQIEKQTRKSNQLKKWLVLISRLLIFTFLILAFSQPYFKKEIDQQNVNVIIYLDNSFSMQAKGKSGELLKMATQKIIENNTAIDNISLITNLETFPNLTVESLKHLLLNLNYYPHQLSLSKVLLKADKLISDENNTGNELFIISDFQKNNLREKIDFEKQRMKVNLIQVTPKSSNNIYIDSVFIDKSIITAPVLNVLTKSIENYNETVPLSLYINGQIIAKATTKFNNSTREITKFSLPNIPEFIGKVTLNDAVLPFDNTYFFSVSKPKKIKVLSIEESASFLNKIFIEDEFNFESISSKNINFNTFQQQHLIILNELQYISEILANNLNEFLEKGGNIIIIPSEKAELASYNFLFKMLQIGAVNIKNEQEQKITRINFEHPLLKDVFQQKATNFQYPSTHLFYSATLPNSSAVLSFANKKAFITSIAKKNSMVFWIASPLNHKISNFTQSPLVVPIFYKIAKQSIQLPAIAQNISENNRIDIDITMAKDKVLAIKGEVDTFIPLQQISENKVSLQFQQSILKSGCYDVIYDQTKVATLAFNVNRRESDLSYANLNAIINKQKNVQQLTNTEAILNKINTAQKNSSLFKWFLAFSVLFLCIEMLLLKYFKI